MVKNLAIGLLAFVAIVLLAATAAIALVDPADFIRERLRGSPLRLDAPYGTFWSGGGKLRLAREPLGALKWRLDPTAIIDRAIAYGWEVRHDGLLRGRLVVRSSGRMQVTAGGRLPTAVANHWLADHGLRLEGQLRLSRTSVVVVNRRVREANSYVELREGKVTGRFNAPALPSLGAQLYTPFGAEIPCVSGRVWTLGRRQTVANVKCERRTVRVEIMGISAMMLELRWLPYWLKRLFVADDSVVCTIHIKLGAGVSSDEKVDVSWPCSWWL